MNSAANTETFTDIIEVAERELSKNCPQNSPEIGQFAPKPDWGVLEALAFANTLANHGWAREANPDAASSCIYALCRHLRTPGNAAAMCEALEEQSRYWNSHIRTRDEEQMRKRTDAALAMPARNCDVGTVEEQMARFEAYCNAHEPCESCPLDRPRVTPSCGVHWAQMPYEEGGAE